MITEAQRSRADVLEQIKELLIDHGATRTRVIDEGGTVKVECTTLGATYEFKPFGRSDRRITELHEWLLSCERSPVGFWPAVRYCRRETLTDWLIRLFPGVQLRERIEELERKLGLGQDEECGEVDNV